ncbi:MAG: D-glycero-beta-D-manno-heptose-7-phosphate kinase [Candidatus Edwardsbacteria bacterium]|nr:D-glycero-beta-D-manno-heptose-7-phosphate kinase [Candidatus Edwardsbacteria bacterium]
MKHTLSQGRALSLVRSFKKARILVLGDLMLDEYLFGQVSRISPEAPVPVVEVSSEKLMLGGAANVAWNIRALGGTAVPVGVIGHDRAGNIMRTEFKSQKIATTGLVAETGRRTTIKTRIVAHHQQVVRVDREHRQDISAASERKVIAALNRLIPKADAMLIEDYNKGLLTDNVIRAALEICMRRGVPVTVDPKLKHFLDYVGATLFKPNVQETERALGVTIADDRDMDEAGSMLLGKLSAQAVLITAGEKGMYLFPRGGKRTHIPTLAREVYDVSGAGDTVISVITLALACGASFEEAAVIANHAAGIEVSKFGVAAVSPEELTEALRSW